MQRSRVVLLVILFAILFMIIFTAVVHLKQQKQKSVPNISTDPYYPVMITDLMGRKVTIEKKPQKAIVLSQAVSEILTGLECDDTIVAVSNDANYPPQFKNKPKVGANSEIDLNMVYSLNPEIIFANKYLYQSIANELTSKNIKVVYAEADSYEGLFNSIEIITKIYSLDNKGNEFAEKISTKVKDSYNRSDGYIIPNVLYIQSIEPLFVAGNKTLVNDIIKLAGGSNAAFDVNGYGELSREKLNDRNIDIILLSSNIRKEIDLDFLKNHALFKDLNAVKNAHVTRVSNEQIYISSSPSITRAIDEVFYEIDKIIFKP